MKINFVGANLLMALLLNVWVEQGVASTKLAVNLISTA